MRIHINSDERTRIETKQSTIFVDASCTPYQESLTIEFYSFHRQIIKLKNGTYKLFVFVGDEDIDSFDFGYWNDGEIIWKSF
jgi:hypothetical protein